MADEFYAPKLVNYLHMKAGKNGIPLAGTFELSPVCNMQCSMCYVRMTPDEIKSSGKSLRTLDEWVSLGREAQKHGMLMLLLTGGEPFLWPDFRKLYQELKKLGLVITINTNGTLINEKVVEWLKKDPPMRLNITLYGASDQTYERLCGNPQGFTQTVQAIRLLKEAGIGVKLNCSATPRNRQDLPEIIRYAQEQELVLQVSTYMFPPLRRDEESIGKNERFTSEETARVSAEVLYRQKGREWFARHMEQVRAGEAGMSYCDEFELEEEEPNEGEQMRCRAGTSSFWITWDGRMLPCGMMNCPEAYPFRDGFEKAWDEIRIETERIRLPAECAACRRKEQCRACAAMVYTETGTFERKPEYLCSIQEAYRKACEEVWEDMEGRRKRTIRI